LLKGRGGEVALLSEASYGRKNLLTTIDGGERIDQWYSTSQERGIELPEERFSATSILRFLLAGLLEPAPTCSQPTF
jgi:hypothetical protein